MSTSLWLYGPWPTRFLCPWDSPGKNTGVGCHALLWGIFPTQWSNSCLLHLLHWQWQEGSLPLVPPRNTRMMHREFICNGNILCLKVLDTWENAHRQNYCITAAAQSLQSCLTLCDPIDGSPPGSPIPGILQARTLEWVAISFSNSWKWNMKVKSLSCVQLLVTPWTAAYQAPPSMGFSRQEYWSGVLLPSQTV